MYLVLREFNLQRGSGPEAPWAKFYAGGIMTSDSRFRFVFGDAVIDDLVDRGVLEPIP